MKPARSRSSERRCPTFPAQACTGTSGSLRKRSANVAARYLRIVCKILFRRRRRSAKGYAAIYKLHPVADGPGVFGFSFRDQSGGGQVHEKRGGRRPQNAADHAHLRPIECVGDADGKAGTMAAVSALPRENPCVAAGRHRSSELSSLLPEVQAGDAH